MKTLTNLALLLLLILSTMFIVSCEKTTDPAVTAEKAIYTGYSGDILYTLTITEVPGAARAYAPKKDDTYTLTSEGKTSSGIVNDVKNSGSTIELKADGDNAILTATVSGNWLSFLDGIISWSTGSGDQAPGPLTQTPGEVEPDIDLCDYYVYVESIGLAPNNTAIVIVENVSATFVQDLPFVWVKINQSDLTYTPDFNEDYQDPVTGLYHFEWHFYWLVGVTPGTTYTVELTVDEDVKTSNLKIVYAPVVTTSPANFNHANPMTYNWTIEDFARKQRVLFQWNSAMDGIDEQEYSLQPHINSWIIPSDMGIPANWAFVYFTLEESNYNVVGNTGFISYVSVEKNFQSSGGGAPRVREENELRRNFTKMLRNGK